MKATNTNTSNHGESKMEITVNAIRRPIYADSVKNESSKKKAITMKLTVEAVRNNGDKVVWDEKNQRSGRLDEENGVLTFKKAKYNIV